MKKNFILIFSGAILVLAFIIYFLPNIITSWRWQKAAEASAGFPYQIGLTKVVIIPCIPVPPPTGPLCTAGPLCTLLTPNLFSCGLHSEVNGIPAGGMGSNALFLNTAIIKAGLTPGGQLIAGGTSPVLMDSGVLASAGGCFGCMAKANFKDKIFNWIDKYIIAGFKNN